MSNEKCRGAHTVIIERKSTTEQTTNFLDSKWGHIDKHVQLYDKFTVLDTGEGVCDAPN